MGVGDAPIFEAMNKQQKNYIPTDSCMGRFKSALLPFGNCFRCKEAGLFRLRTCPRRGWARIRSLGDTKELAGGLGQIIYVKT